MLIDQQDSNILPLRKVVKRLFNGTYLSLCVVTLYYKEGYWRRR